MRIAILLSVINLLVPVCQAAEPPITPQALGELLGYPSEAIVVEETTTKVNERQVRKSAPLVISAHYYTSADRSFAPVYVAVGKSSTLLTPELKDKYEKSVKNPDLGRNLREIGDSRIGSGFAGIGMPSQGNQAHMSMVNIPSLGLDVQAIISVPRDIPEKAGAEVYLAQIKSGAVDDLLESCVLAVGESLVTKAVVKGDGGILAPDLPSSESKEVEIAENQPGNQSGTEDSSFPDHYLWIAGGVFVVILVAIFYRRLLSRR